MLGGHRALDLANTTHWREGGVVDFVPDYLSLLRWSVPAGLLAEGEAEPLLRLARQDAPHAADVLDRWLALRAAFKAFLAHAVGRATEPADASAPLADLLDGEMRRARFVAGKDGVRAVGEDALALPLLRSALAVAEFLAFAPRGAARRCEADPCGGYFLDDSRSKPRRWCAMDTCGNRAKVRRHRERRAKPSPGG